MMDDRPEQANLLDLAASVAEGLDSILAMLLLAKRAHVENVTLAAPGRARVELSGDVIENGLAALAQVLTLKPIGLKSAGKEDDDEDEDDEEDGGEERKKSSNANELWQALKDFALPPVKTRRKK